MKFLMFGIWLEDETGKPKVIIRSRLHELHSTSCKYWFRDEKLREEFYQALDKIEKIFEQELPSKNRQPGGIEIPGVVTPTTP